MFLLKSLIWIRREICTDQALFTSENSDGCVDYLLLLLWHFHQLFELKFWRHPFTAEDPLVSKSVVGDEETNSSTNSSWMAWRWVHFQQIFIFGWLFLWHLFYFYEYKKYIQIIYLDDNNSIIETSSFQAGQNAVIEIPKSNKESDTFSKANSVHADFIDYRWRTASGGTQHDVFRASCSIRIDLFSIKINGTGICNRQSSSPRESLQG